ncbi:hypothetical protein CHU93_01425 [Sandarakinorhabdus cyanobacteriorum]|uniref:GAF domain-containing protein n=1 Tax=Sandarakinorhabdus cyanobacteriorum TaxID=1981098 RepID=A0A255Z4D5_9SPHN|nr:hypothetical protein CHU93_01425 [Sandarakinorhabdus cyanobacteriorum]
MRIDGAALKGVDQAQVASILAKRPHGSEVLVETRHPDGTINTAAFVRSQENYRTFFGGLMDQDSGRSFAVAISITHGLTFFFVGVILLRKRTAVVPQMLALSLLLPNFFLPDYTTLGPVVFGAYTVLTAILAGILFNALLAFPDGRYRSPVSVMVGLLAFLVWWLAASDVLGEDVIWPILQIAVIAAALWQMMQKYRSVDDDTMRQQFRWVMLGLALCALCWACGLVADWAYVAIAAAFPGEAFNALHGSLRLANTALSTGGPIFIPLGILVALLRFRLYDVDLIIGRTSTYVATTAFLAIGSFLVERAATFAGPRLLGEEVGGLSYGVGAAFASLSMGPLHERLVHWSEKRFQARLISLRDDLPHVIRDMSYVDTREELLETALSRICYSAYAEKAAILSSDGRQIFRAHGIAGDAVGIWAATHAWDPGPQDYLVDPDDPLFPLIFPLQASGETGQVHGWLAVGRRRDETLINRDERAVLASLSAPLARALMLIEAREEEKNLVLDRIDQIERAVEAIRSDLRLAIGRIGAS